MKKIIALLLVAIAVIGVFSGCGPSDTEKNSDGKTITIGIPLRTNVEDYDTNALTLWIEEKTGYNIEFQYYASLSSDYATQLSTQLLDPSVKLPDMLMQFDSLTGTAWKQYGEDDYFIDLTPYFEDKEKSKEWWDAMSALGQERIDAAFTKCTAQDGGIYAYPHVESSMVDPLPFIAHINQKWLEQVNMPAPTNPQELLEVLRAFKTQICKDNTYYPLLGAGPSILGGDLLWWLICMFCPGYNYDDFFRLSADGKKIEAPVTTPEYRQALIYIRQLIDEGLLSDSIFSIKDKEYRAILGNEAGSRAGVIVFHSTVSFTVEDSPNLYDYVPLDLYGYCPNPASRTCTQGTFITVDAEDPDACWEILMLLATPEGAVRMRYGDEGENWTWAEEGQTTLMGVPAKINLIRDPFGTVGNVNWGSPSPSVIPYAEGEWCLFEGMSDWQVYRYNLNSQGYYNYMKHYNAQDNRFVLPEIVLDADELRETRNERGNVANTALTYRTNFLKREGGLDLENPAHWQAYLDELNRMGLQTWMAQVQSIYEQRYMEDVMARAQG